MHRLWVKSALGIVIVMGVANGALAASWADALFSEKAHDFGPVPRGGMVHHSFVLTNRLQEGVTILNIRASCGCTTGRTNATLVKPGQSAVIEAEMDTRNFVGPKATTLYVTLMTAGGQEGEANLGVSATILSDVVLNPGSIDFGGVAKGQTPTQTLTIDRVGMPSWRVHKMVSTSRVLNATLTETVRDGSSVGYFLSVSLKPDAPAGPVRDEIRLLSNDPETASIPILVTAQIRGELTAKPSLLQLGRVTSPAGLQGRFLVLSAQPCVIQSIDGDGDGFSATVNENARATTHVVTVTYRPNEGTTRGDLRHAFRIQTDLPGEPTLEVSATVHTDP